MNIPIPRNKKRTLLAVSGILLSLSIFATATFASLSDNLFGYAWSSNIGWIKMNNCFSASDCTGPTNDPSGPVGFGVKIAPTGTTRDLSGYAWSSNIGWITFNTGSYTTYDPATDYTTMLDHCAPSSFAAPGASCHAYVQWGTTGGASVPLKGWARACSVYVSGCSGAIKPPYSIGAWDGWIALGDDNSADGANYGVTMNTATGALTGYGWGSAVVGWVNFSDVKVEDPVMCPDGSTPPTPGNINSCSECQGSNPSPLCVVCPWDGTPPIPGDVSSCPECQSSNPPAACNIIVCPWDGAPVNGVCPTTHPCPDGTNLPTGQQCPDTSCPNGATPVNGMCPTGGNCSDGSAPVGGVCQNPPSCSVGTACYCTANPSDTTNCPGNCQVGQPCWCAQPAHQSDPVCATGGPTGGGNDQCKNIPGTSDNPATIEGQMYANGALQFPPYRHMSDGRCLCANGYVLNAQYQCVKINYNET